MQSAARKTKKKLLTPWKVQEVLKITKTERQRWTKDGRLPCAEERERYLYGQYVSIPYYDPEEIQKISLNTIELWRKQDAEQKIQNRRQAVQKAVQTRTQKLEETKEYREMLKNNIKKWNSRGEKYGIFYESCFWLALLNRLIKTLQKAKKRKAVSQLYCLKNNALFLLYEAAGDILKLSFYCPENPDKIIVCESCSCGSGYDDDDYYDDDDDCENNEFYSYEVYKDYYSLYLFEFVFDDEVFSFHMPYPIGKDILPEKTELPQSPITNETWNPWGRFGRPLNEIEEKAFSPNRIIKKIEKQIEKLQIQEKSSHSCRKST